ncbi:hypothetical protein HNP81_004573 [Peribacillus huizhouensis]|uniref:Sigma factor G inhibitor Gin n=2 Tax=Peribacillus huizhouensis TaxID=1501239 RepID=A0ABR6CW96_9BACI|nr:hypothetical protein [Peribacillus huizhouensis]
MEMSTIKKNTEETCIVCDQVKDDGIHLYTSFICKQCELDMIGTETDDPRYKYYLQRLKKVKTPEIYS